MVKAREVKNYWIVNADTMVCTEPSINKYGQNSALPPESEVNF